MSDPLVDDLRAALGREAVLDAPADRAQWAGDASIYSLVPRVVVVPRRVEDVQAALRVAAARGAPVCFRAGGTSLSGQAVTDGVLIVISRWFRGIRVLDGGVRVACGPGAVGAWVNAALAAHGRRIGPDPASMQAAEVGGIVANNASGMCCGVAQNSYHTVSGLDLVLADGWRLDTAAPDADERMRRERPALAEGITRLRDELRAHPTLPERVRRAFATKNTVGYSLNAFLDEDAPARILQRLVVGSEGTLAFIAEATFRTLPLPRHRATAWLVFRDVEAAGAAVHPLASLGPAAIELLDAVALRRVAAKLPDLLPAGEPAALLVEFQDAEAPSLERALAAAAPVLAELDLAAPAAFTRDAALQARLWAIRKGLFPSVGAIRAAGTAVVIEDVTFPVATLAAGVRRLRALFAAHGYDDAVIFGHAKDGNLHFTLTPDFARAGERERYDRFMRALVDLVLDEGGHLKAEHGTGRNMAPFVARQWGDDAVAVMRAVKRLLDPGNLLNPGVLLSDDPEAHLRHLKTLPSVDPVVDRCIECGFCEPVCPSRDATMSPRQRIVALRARARGGEAAAAVAGTWNESVVETCAGDGLCARACPVAIDTGDLVRAERAAARSPWQRRLAAIASKRFDLVARGARAALRLAGGRRLPGRDIALPPVAPLPPRHWPAAEPGGPTFCYVPSCLARTLGEDPLPALLARLCAAAGVGVVLPRGAAGLCCGQPFASKGFPAAADAAARRLAAALVANDLPLVGDTSTCVGQWEAIEKALPERRRAAWRARRRYDPATFAAEVLLPRLAARGRIRRDDVRLALHPTCADQKHGWDAALTRAASACADAVTPLAVGCCGMAGDKGWSAPALTRAATAREAAEARGAAAGATTSATCALALGAASGLRYRHVWAVLGDAMKRP